MNNTKMNNGNRSVLFFWPGQLFVVASSLRRTLVQQTNVELLPKRNFKEAGINSMVIIFLKILNKLLGMIIYKYCKSCVRKKTFIKICESAANDNIFFNFGYMQIL